MKLRPRLRVVRTVAVLLLLGATVNVLVAWGCVIAVPAGWAARPALSPVPSDHLVTRPGWLIDHRFENFDAGTGVTETLVWYSRTAPAPATDYGVICRAGWPCGALACATFDLDFVITIEGGIRVPGLTSSLYRRTPSAPSRPLPCLPRWPGFAINTALYTAVLTCGFLGVRWSWRRIRHRPGCCRACGYDLKGNVGGVCPECGAKA